MIDEDTLLLKAQEHVQSFLASRIEKLLSEGADGIARDRWITSVRFSSEETWLRCSAFLLAHSLGRFLARCVPGRGAGPSQPWVDAFVAAVAAGDTDAEVALWTSPPIASISAGAAASQ